MTLKVVWGITGSGDKMPETVAAMAAVRERLDLEITAAVSIAGVRVLRWYKLTETVEEIAKSVKIEKDANSPFITGPSADRSVRLPAGGARDRELGGEDRARHRGHAC